MNESQRGDRAKRALIAGYIHELSERHRAARQVRRTQSEQQPRERRLPLPLSAERP
jgi:hypothetical protein